MIKVNVGDFVETIDGKAGCVIGLVGNYKFVWKCGDDIYEQMIPESLKIISKYYNRIGSQDFTVKENKIELLKNHVNKYDAYAIDGIGIIKDTLIYEKLPDAKELMDKINEIITYINKEDK